MKSGETLTEEAKAKNDLSGQIQTYKEVLIAYNALRNSNSFFSNARGLIFKRTPFEKEQAVDQEIADLILLDRELLQGKKKPQDIDLGGRIATLLKYIGSSTLTDMIAKKGLPLKSSENKQTSKAESAQVQSLKTAMLAGVASQTEQNMDLVTSYSKLAKKTCSSLLRLQSKQLGSMPLENSKKIVEPLATKANEILQMNDHARMKEGFAEIHKGLSKLPQTQEVKDIAENLKEFADPSPKRPSLK